jgi:microcystin-dependent protein
MTMSPATSPTMNTCSAFRTAGWAAPIFLALLALLAPASSRAASANPPEFLSYQGYVTDSAGVALGNTSPSNYDVIFRIYDASQGGNKLWVEQQTVTVDRGHFSVLLGEGAAVEVIPKPSLMDVFSGIDASDRYIGITVKGLVNPDAEIAPRLRLLASPYAFLARRAVAVVNDAGTSLLNATTGGLVVNQPLGIQYATPHFPLSLGPTLANTKLALYDASATSVYGFGVQGGQFRIHLDTASSRFSFMNAPNGTEVVTITGGGRLGIGTGASPKQALHNTGDYYGKGHVWLYANQGDGVDGTVYLQARDDSLTSAISMQLRTKRGNTLAEAVHINPDGNVGVKRQSDGRSLDVSGTVRATTFEGNGTIPVGGIIMWSGTSVPAGWGLCDGTGGRPDLRDRFVIGGTTANVGQTGGANTATLSVANLPAHTHNFSVGTVGYAASWNGSAEATRAPNQGRNNGNQTQGTGSTGSGTAFSILPPFYRLAFIMRTQ